MTRLRDLLVCLLTVVLLTTGTTAQPVRADSRPVLVARDWQTYLRLAPLSVHDGYIPLLYNPGPELSPAVLHFAELYGGVPLTLDVESVQQRIDAQWSRSETIVVAQEQPRLGMIAAAIAAALDSPLFFELPAETDLRSHGVNRLIAVGEVAFPARATDIVLREAADAQAYYNQLVGPRPVAILASDDGMAFLAAGAVAYHRGNLLLAAKEVREFQPRHLAWVTSPSKVTKAAVYNLYDLCRFSAASQVYDVGVGILTGVEPHDVALLVARAYAYPQLAGSWKTRLLTAGEKSVPVDHSLEEPTFDSVTLTGRDFTGDAFLEALRSVGYVGVEAHGSPTGLALSDGSWPGRRTISRLPPLVFVAESCETGDLSAYGIQTSVALRIISGGAAAYIGSLEVGGVGLVGRYPYAFSTPAMPLGTLVRLQTAARMAVDADAPRVILIGDPTFHQIETEWLSYETMAENGEISVQIRARGAIGPALIYLELQNDDQVQYARFHGFDGVRLSYMPGMPYADTFLGRTLAFERPLSSALTFGCQTVLLEWPGGDGVVTFYSTRPLAAFLRRTLSDGLIGVQGIFIDIFSMQGTAAPLAIVSVAVLLIVRRRRRAPDVFWSGIAAGIGMSLVGILYCLGLGFAIPWFVTVMVGCGATTVVWLLAPRWCEWQRIVLCALVYAAPLVVVLLFAAAVGASRRTLILVLLGMALTAVTYALVVTVAALLVARLLRAAPTSSLESAR